MSRPKGCIYPNCLNCPLPECEYDGIEIDDEADSRAIDFAIIHSRTVENHYRKGTYSTYDSKRRYSISEKGKVAQKRYRDSDKGRMKQHRYNHSAKGIAARQRYEQSDKGKEAKKRYSQTLRFKEAQKSYFLSEKGIDARNRYLNSEKGKDAQKRKAQKDIDSGKNAERCKRYYERHRAEILAKAKAKREAMKI